MNENQFEIILNGDLEKADAGTFLALVGGLDDLVQEISSTVTDQQVRLKITAVERSNSILSGFELDIMGAAQPLLTLGTAKDIIGLLKNLFELKKHIGKDTPQVQHSGSDGVILTNNKGPITVNKNVYNISMEPSADKALTTVFEAITSDPAITGYRVKANDEQPDFIAERDELEDAKGKNPLLETTSDSEEEVAELYVHKLVFEEGRKWEFIWRGERISADISDSTFFERINRGEQFRKGDLLKVKLKTTETRGTNESDIPIKTFEITNVIEHVEGSEQPPLSSEGS